MFTLGINNAAVCEKHNDKLHIQNKLKINLK